MLNQKSLVVQSNKLIEAKYRLSIEEQKIIKILVSQIRQDDENFKNYEFRIKDLADLLGMEHTNIYGVLRSITRRLMTRILEFYNSETKTLLQAAWLSSAEYKEGQGTIILCFDPKLKPLLLQLKSYFTKYELGQILQFKGQYTVRFFEFRKSFLGRNRKAISFTLKELREVLGLKKGEYDQFFDFKKRVLEPARLELLEKTGKSFAWEPVKQGRGGKIIAVNLVFDAEDTPVIDPAAQEITLIESKDQSHPLNSDEIAVVNELLQIGLTEEVAYEVVKNNPVDLIKEKLTLTRQQKDVQNQPGFFIEALRGDWHTSKVDKAKQQQQQRQERENQEKQNRKLCKLKNDFLKYKADAARKQYEKASAGLVEEWKRLFFEEQPVWKDLLRGKNIDFENPLFRAFVMSRFDLPTAEEFLIEEAIHLSQEEQELWNTLIQQT